MIVVAGFSVFGSVWQEDWEAQASLHRRAVGKAHFFFPGLNELLFSAMITPITLIPLHLRKFSEKNKVTCHLRNLALSSIDFVYCESCHTVLSVKNVSGPPGTSSPLRLKCLYCYSVSIENRRCAFDVISYIVSICFDKFVCSCGRFFVIRVLMTLLIVYPADSLWAWQLCQSHNLWACIYW